MAETLKVKSFKSIKLKSVLHSISIELNQIKVKLYQFFCLQLLGACVLLVTAGADFVGHNTFNQNGHHSSHNQVQLSKYFLVNRNYFYLQAVRQGRQDDGAVQVG